MMRFRGVFRNAPGCTSRDYKPAGVKGFASSRAWRYILRTETLRCPLCLRLEENPAAVSFLLLFFCLSLGSFSNLPVVWRPNERTRNTTKLMTVLLEIIILVCKVDSWMHGNGVTIWGYIFSFKKSRTKVFQTCGSHACGVGEAGMCRESASWLEGFRV